MFIEATRTHSIESKYETEEEAIASAEDRWKSMPKNIRKDITTFCVVKLSDPKNDIIEAVIKDYLSMPTMAK